MTEILFASSKSCLTDKNGKDIAPVQKVNWYYDDVTNEYTKIVVENPGGKDIKIDLLSISQKKNTGYEVDISGLGKVVPDKSQLDDPVMIPTNVAHKMEFF